MTYDNTTQIHGVLRRTLGDGGVHAALQPIRRQGYPVMVEALARFDGPLGAHPVDQVIAAAEAIDVVHIVSEMVLRDALSLVRAATHWHGRVAWNVSPTHLMRSDFAPRVEAILAEARFPFDRLVIEITESAPGLGEECTPALTSLRGRGASIAIDDFGTGWSSISRLAGFPVDIVKIDRSLVRGVTSRRGADIIRSVISLCAAIGASVIVEGVENDAELAALSGLHDGTCLVQGFLTGRPTRDIDVALIGATAPTDHTVCLYDTDEAFTAEICAFIEAGRNAAKATVAVLRSGQTARVRGELRRRGIDPEGPTVTFLDAESTLEAILTDGRVDTAKFRRATATFIAEHPTEPVQFCGEMVTMLWERDDVVGALLLEDLWNHVSGQPPVTVLCGYPGAIVTDAEDQLAIELLHSDLYSTTGGDTAPTPPERDERRRTADLYALGLLEPTSHHIFDAVTELAVNVFDADYAFVSLVDTERQWFVSQIGFEYAGAARHVSFCAHTIMSDEPLIVHDARRDRRFRDSPFVTAAPHVISYAGAPVHAPSGSRIGAVCVASSHVRRLSLSDRRQLSHLGTIADAVVAQRAEAVTDHLTGLYDRRGFLNVLHRLTESIDGEDLVIVLADVNGLRTLNETLGHAAGDRALVAVAALLNSTFSDAAAIGRIDDNTFGGIFTGHGAAATARSQTVRAGELLGQRGTRHLGLTAIAITRRSAEGAPAIMARADRALDAEGALRARVGGAATSAG